MDTSDCASKTTTASVVEVDDVKTREQKKYLEITLSGSAKAYGCHEHRNTAMLDITYIPKASYDEFSTWSQGKAVLLGLGNKSEIRPRTPLRVKPRKFLTKNERIKQTQEVKRRLLRLKKQMREQYMKITSTIYLQLANETTRRLNWYSPVQLCVYQARSLNYTYLVITAAGRLRIKSVHIVLAKHLIRIFSHFSPGVGVVNDVWHIFIWCHREICVNEFGSC